MLRPGAQNATLFTKLGMYIMLRGGQKNLFARGFTFLALAVAKPITSASHVVIGSARYALVKVALLSENFVLYPRNLR